MLGGVIWMDLVVGENSFFYVYFNIPERIAKDRSL